MDPRQSRSLGGGIVIAVNSDVDVDTPPAPATAEVNEEGEEEENRKEAGSIQANERVCFKPRLLFTIICALGERHSLGILIT